MQGTQETHKRAKKRSTKIETLFSTHHVHQNVSNHRHSNLVVLPTRLDRFKEANTITHLTKLVLLLLQMRIDFSLQTIVQRLLEYRTEHKQN